jgi:hypothetical protein
MFEESRGDRTRLDQRHLDAGACELHAERIGEYFHGEFRGAIGAAIRCGHQAKHRGAKHDAPMALRPHGRDEPGGEIMPAEHIDLELGADHLRR